MAVVVGGVCGVANSLVAIDIRVCRLGWMFVLSVSLPLHFILSVCMHMDTWTHVHLCMETGLPQVLFPKILYFLFVCLFLNFLFSFLLSSVLIFFLSYFFFLFFIFFKKGPLIFHMQLADLARLVGKWVPRICQSLLLQHWDYKRRSPWLTFYMGSVDGAQVVMQDWQLFPLPWVCFILIPED